jgi:hypothetical protein
MPVLVRTILDAIPKMANVGLLCAFLLLVFGIFGMQVYHGQLHYRCALPGYAATLDPVTGRSSLLPEAQRNYDTEVPCSLADDASCAGVHVRILQREPGRRPALLRQLWRGVRRDADGIHLR